MITWEECKKVFDSFNGHYSMSDVQKKVVFDCAKNLEQGDIAVEIGVAHGKNAAMLIELGKHVGFKYVGIDNFSLDSTYDTVKSNLDSLGAEYELIRADTKQLNWDRPMGLLIIDGGHALPEVSNDTAKFIKHVKPSGYLFLHDYVRLEQYYNDHPHASITYHGEMYTNGWEDLGLYESQLKVKRRPEDLKELIIKAPDIPKPLR